jgi:hypothetical protein
MIYRSDFRAKIAFSGLYYCMTGYDGRGIRLRTLDGRGL